MTINNWKWRKTFNRIPMKMKKFIKKNRKTISASQPVRISLIMPSKTRPKHCKQKIKYLLFEIYKNIQIYENIYINMNMKSFMDTLCTSS